MKNMFRKTLYIVSCLLVACADNSEKYRDLHHLEMPPVLPVEQRQVNVSEPDDKPEMVGKSGKKSPLDGILKLLEEDGKPAVLQISTRIDRAWDLTGTALILASLPVVDKNGPDKSYLVRYPGGEGFLDGLFSNPREYHLNLKDGITGVKLTAQLAKQASNGETQDAADGDESDALIRRLYKALQDKVINK